MTTVSADGLTTTTQTDAAGTGVFNQTIVDAIAIDASGNRTETATDTSANGTVTAKQVTVHNADGKTGSASDYVNYGAGLVQTLGETKTLNGAGAIVDTVTRFAANGAEASQSVGTTTADGLSRTVQTDVNGDGAFDFTDVSAAVVNASGSMVTRTRTSANGGAHRQDGDRDQRG